MERAYIEGRSHVFSKTLPRTEICTSPRPTRAAFILGAKGRLQYMYAYLVPSSFDSLNML